MHESLTNPSLSLVHPWGHTLIGVFLCDCLNIAFDVAVNKMRDDRCVCIHDFLLGFWGPVGIMNVYVVLYT